MSKLTYIHSNEREYDALYFNGEFVADDYYLGQIESYILLMKKVDPDLELEIYVINDQLFEDLFEGFPDLLSDLLPALSLDEPFMMRCQYLLS